MALDAGSAHIQILPSFRGFGAAVRREAAAAGRDAAAAFNETYNAGLRSGNRPSVGPDRTESAREGNQSAGAFADAFRARLAAASRALPPIQVGVATSEAEQELRDLQVKIAALRDVTIGVDIDEGEARAQLASLQAELARVGANSPSIQVKVDAGRAAAELAALQAAINRVDGQNPTVTPIVNPAPAIAGIGLIGLAALTLLPIIIPVAAAASVALAGIATGAVVAAAGIGVLALGLFGVVKAVIAGKAASEEGSKATAGLAGQQAAAAGSARQLESAQRGLTNARATAARQEELSARSIADAQRRVSDARVAAAQSAVDSAQRVRDAETNLADAQGRARDAQLALTDARKSAAEAMQDLDSRVKNGALGQREANLRLRDAETRLAEARASGSTASVRQVAEAQLAYDQARQRVDDLAVSQRRLVVEQKASAKAGVEGSAQVVGAQKNIVEAGRTVARAERDVSDARAAQAKAASASARAVADAERGVGDARRAAADQARQSAAAIANAQAAVVSAQAAVAASATSMGAAGTSAADKYRKALNDLTPAGRRLVAFIQDSVIPGFKKLADTAQRGLLPGLESGLRSLGPLFGPINRLVGVTSRAFGELFESAGRALNAPFWRQFIDFLTRSMGPNVEIFGRIMGGLARGLAGLFQAFGPLSTAFGQGLANLTQRFADFGEAAAAGKSKGFNAFLAYAQEVGPKVVEFLAAFGRALGTIVRGLAPFGADIMAGLTIGLNLISKIPPALLGAVAAGVLAIVVAVKAWVVAQVIFNAVISANPIGLLVFALIGLAAALIYAYRHCTAFREIVDGAFKAIGLTVSTVWKLYIKPQLDALVRVINDGIIPAVLFLWHEVIDPAFSAISSAVQTAWQGYIRPALKAFARVINEDVIPALNFLWTDVVVPVFSAIGTVIKATWDKVLRPTLSAFRKIIAEGIGPAIVFLWTDVVVPAFGAIGTVVQTVWDRVLHPALKAFRKIIEGIGAAINFLWTSVVVPAFSAIGSVISAAWETVIQPTFKTFKKSVGGFGEVFEAAVKAIKTAWDKIKDIAKKPVLFVVNTVIGNLVGVIDKLSGWFGLPQIGTHLGLPLKFASGGVMPGYTPGRDNQLIAVGGGEAIMRPEWTRAVGADYVHAANAAARAGGVDAVRRHFGIPGYARGGIPGIPRIPNPIDSIKKLAEKGIDLGKDAGNFLKDPLGFMADQLSGPLRAMDKLGDSPFIQMIRKLPEHLVNGIIRQVAKKLGFGGGGPGVEGGLAYARDQVGKPYIWGGVGPAGFDCSGFMSALTNVIQGREPNGRLFATSSFADGRGAGGFVPGPGTFSIGVVQGNPGHMAGTLAGTNVESRGGRGVVVGPEARGATDALFTKIFHLADTGAPAGGSEGGGVKQWESIASAALRYAGAPQSWLGSLMRRMGQESSGDPNAINRWDSNADAGHPSQGLMQLIPATFAAYGRELRARGITDPFANIVASIRYANSRYGNAPTGWDRSGGYSLGGVVPTGYDSGGMLPPGLSTVINATGKPEPVLTTAQWSTLSTLARGSDGASAARGPVVSIGEFHATPQQSPNAIAEDLAWLTRRRG